MLHGIVGMESGLLIRSVLRISLRKNKCIYKAGKSKFFRKTREYRNRPYFTKGKVVNYRYVHTKKWERTIQAGVLNTWVSIIFNCAAFRNVNVWEELNQNVKIFENVVGYIKLVKKSGKFGVVVDSRAPVILRGPLSFSEYNNISTTWLYMVAFGLKQTSYIQRNHLQTIISFNTL